MVVRTVRLFRRNFPSPCPDRQVNAISFVSLCLDDAYVSDGEPQG
jgi:hypothetical protein